MHILVFSDTHIDDVFCEKKYNYLSHIIRQSDQVIVNGDLWDGYDQTFDQFLDSPWKHLFPLLLQKNAVYIYGNHDSRVLSDERTSLFSVHQTYAYQISEGKQRYIFEHGHEQAWFPMYFKNDSYPVSTKNQHKMASYIQQMALRTKLRELFRYGNESIKRTVCGTLGQNDTYFCGHTHYAEYDKEKRFINSGIFHFGIAEYVTITNGSIQLHQDKYI
jgi:predicted phosphodiesterase